MRKLCLKILCWLLPVAPAAMQAQFTYITNADNTLTVTGYLGAGGNVAIPRTIDNMTVADIGTNAFAGAALTSLDMPDSIVNLMGSAFYACTNLTNIALSANLANIGPGALGECALLANVNIPDGVTNIGSFAFIFCASLSNISIPASVTGIGQAAFQDCANLTNVTLAAGLANIGSDAFAYCSRLASITIPGTVTNIGQGAFEDCVGMTSAYLDKGVGSIAMDMFQNCQSLNAVSMAGGLTNIGDYAFSGAILNSVRIPRSVTSVGEGAFSGARMASVTISSNVTSIGLNAFSICPNLTNITVVAPNAFYASHDGVLFDAGLDTLLQFPAALGGTGSYAIPSSVNNIAEGAFAGCNLAGITAPRGVSNIETGAFYGDTNLQIVFFEGNAPVASPSAFESDAKAAAYYLPGACGWSTPFAGLPALLWNPAIQSGGAGFGAQGNQFGFNINGTSNIVLVVEGCANLADPVWAPLQTIALTNGTYRFSQPMQSNGSGYFYRLSSP